MLITRLRNLLPTASLLLIAIASSAASDPRTTSAPLERCLGKQIAALNPTYRNPIARAMKAIVDRRYNVRVEGLEDVLSRGHEKILFLPNHPALIDPLIVLNQLGPVFDPAPVIDERVAQ